MCIYQEIVNQCQKGPVAVSIFEENSQLKDLGKLESWHLYKLLHFTL